MNVVDGASGQGVLCNWQVVRRRDVLQCWDEQIGEDGSQAINVLPAIEYSSERADMKIMDQAILSLRDDWAGNRDHVLRARVHSIKRGEDVHALYRRYATNVESTRFPQPEVLSNDEPRCNQFERTNLKSFYASILLM